jgi:hypothetical protein
MGEATGEVDLNNAHRARFYLFATGNRHPRPVIGLQTKQISHGNPKRTKHSGPEYLTARHSSKSGTTTKIGSG